MPLVKAACHLQFTEHEFTDFFSEISPLDEDACSYSYTANRDGMRVQITIFPIDGGVYLDLFRDGVSGAILNSRLEGCTHSRFIQYGSIRYLEIGRPHSPTSLSEVALDWGLRLAIDPHFRMEFIHESR
jgi:hypothetical protein